MITKWLWLVLAAGFFIQAGMYAFESNEIKGLIYFALSLACSAHHNIARLEEKKYK